ncbi:DUF4450 domain-containing protein [Formosa sp. 4Alg 33]|uniref:DUF4450 domain-containing protein n=1 Tax=Formosa sp. 4Alg 33 TaxID=3382189 RepID=UPI003D9C0D55
MAFKLKYMLLSLVLLGSISTFSQASQTVWHDTIRQLHYKPDGRGFKLVDGSRKFNRALYGTNTGFRVETGDLPEFAMYMPGMGGNFKLGITNGTQTKWITACDEIATRYEPGTMLYEIRDVLLNDGIIKIQVVALAESEGFITKISVERVPNNTNLIWGFGGATGKKFHRDGDIGADPESVFYLQPKYCINNEFEIKKTSFKLHYGSESNKKKTGNNRTIIGQFPEAKVKLASAYHQKSPEDLFKSKADSLPVFSGKLNLQSDAVFYWKFENSEDFIIESQTEISEAFKKGIEKVKQLSARVQIETPDAYINTLGGALAVAGDGIWEDPAYLHGAVAWRMHLNAWRGASVADALGWKDRAETHFKSYGKSQVLEPETGPVVLDSLRNFARQKEVLGTSMFSRGYISRRPNNNTIAHHYDMNSVFINQLLRHYLWTGDLEFMKDMWPVVKMHLAWEKRNYDVDNDGLYDAYACIWASDALQYSGGGVTYASAYNYSANKLAAQIAQILGEDSSLYEAEAKHIKQAVQEQLWIGEKGVFAEFKDLLGNKLLHEEPGLWTIYHSLDEGIADGFQEFQMLNYVDQEIPHIPITTNNPEHTDLFLVSTTNWQPYTWSVNNVALAENLHASLAYWQGGKQEKAFQLWKSALVETMYYGASPGGFQQLSFYDAIRGELYRDFADPIGMAARSLVEGLFGVQPNALENTLVIQPGFPKYWNHAAINVPDVSYSFKRDKHISTYHIEPKFNSDFNLKLLVKPEASTIKQITINNKKVDWKLDGDAIGQPNIIIESDYKPEYDIEITWGKTTLDDFEEDRSLFAGETFVLKPKDAKLLQIKDPQDAFFKVDLLPNHLKAIINLSEGYNTVFVKLNQDDMTWWEPVSIKVKPRIQIENVEHHTQTVLVLFKTNFENESIKSIKINGDVVKNKIEKTAGNLRLEIDKRFCVPGTNLLDIETKRGETISLTFQDWDLILNDDSKTEMIVMPSFNAKVSEVFEQKYMSPRPTSPTLQLPTQGIGNWCYPYIAPIIDDTGLREEASESGFITSNQQIPLNISNTEQNIVFTSMWDNFPETFKIPLKGKAKHAYFLMAGTTNPMQTHMENGSITVYYTDGTSDILSLKNPENWWPIEQDYFVDGFAFKTNATKPPRLYLKSGKFNTDFKDYKPIKGFSDYAIDGGAATLLDLPLNPEKTLDHFEVKTITNDVVIGVMSITLIRD